MQEAYRPCLRFAPRQPVRASWRVFHHTLSCPPQQTRRCTHHRSCCRAQRSNLQQQAVLHGVKQKLWPSLGVLSSFMTNPTAAGADEITTAAGDVAQAAAAQAQAAGAQAQADGAQAVSRVQADAAQAAAKATADLQPTVTFGGGFGQYDPIIAFFFYAVIATLTVLTLGVAYLSIRSWQISTDEAKERASFSRSTQNRESGQMSLKAKARRQPPKSKANKGESKGFGS